MDYSSGVRNTRTAVLYVEIARSYHVLDQSRGGVRTFCWRAMNPKTLSDTLSWIITLGTFALAFVGVVFRPVALQTFRPAVLSTNDGSGTDPSPKFARMWDDPFVVFPPDRFVESLEVLSKVTQPTLVLACITSTTVYPEDSETRLRYRFAVQAALRDAGYIPEDSEHLFYFPEPLPLFPYKSVIWRPPFFKVRLPTERFFLKETETNQDRRFGCVQLIWIPSEIFSGDSPGTMCSFLDEWIQHS